MFRQLQQYGQKNFVDAFKGLPTEVWYLAVNQLINRSGLMVVPFMALYLTTDLQWAEGKAGFAIMFFGFGSVAGSLLGGWLSDKLGPYRTIFLSNVLGGLAFLFMMSIQSFYFLCFWIFLTSTLADAARPAVFTAVTDFTGEHNVTRGISLLRMAINLGIAIGPAIGGFLIALYGYHWIFIMDGVTCIAAGVAMYFLFRQYFGTYQHPKARSDVASPYRDGVFVIYLLLNLLVLTVFFQILYTVPLYFKQVLKLTEADIGIFFTMNGLLIFFLEMPIVYYFEKQRRFFRSLILGALLIGLGYILLMLPLPYAWLIVIVFNVVVSVGEIINFPFISSIAIFRTGPHNKGKYMGAVTVLFSMAFVFAPITGLPLLEHISFELLWSGCFLVILLASFGLWFIRSRFGAPTVADPES